MKTYLFHYYNIELEIRNEKQEKIAVAILFNLVDAGDAVPGGYMPDAVVSDAVVSDTVVSDAVVSDAVVSDEVVSC